MQIDRSNCIFEPVQKLKSHKDSLKLARSLHASGQLALAHQQYIALLKQHPNSAELYNELANLLVDGKHFELAIKAYLKAIQISPDYAIAHYNLGNCHLKINQYQNAQLAFENALRIQPRFYEAALNLGNTFRHLGQNAKAVAYFENAIAISPSSAGPLINLGSLHYEARNLKQAQSCFESALRLDPASSQAHWNLALLLLMKGQFSEAWPHYEWRWKRGGYCHANHRNFAQPVWLGQFSIQGKALLVHAEQGMGDTLQFVRFIQDLHTQGAKIFLEVQAPLVSLLRQLPNVEQVFARGEPLPHFEAHCGLMSLPYALKINLKELINSDAYLQPHPQKVAQWKKRLPPHQGLRVGLVWSGGFRPNQPEVWQLNERRNLPLEQLKSLNLPGIQWISLQKGDHAENELAKLTALNWGGPPLLNFSHLLTDFSETAALIACLDLVISVDTSTAHLAGAMGRQTWILNRFDACWRWGIDQSTTPWYQHVKLYKQTQPGLWSDVVSQVQQDLQTLQTSFF